MFKLLYNSKLILLLLAISIFGCHNNKTKQDTLNESISKFVNSLKPVEIVEFIPKEYTQVISDTILSNGFRVKIKSYTNMEKSVHKTIINDNYINQNNNYRDWISEVKIEKDGKLIWSETINDDFFLKNEIQKELFLSKAININVRVDEENSIKKDSITLIAGYFDPFENHAVLFNLEIDVMGNHNLKKSRV
ncbi:hypothetical protein [Litoribaculum gwangyangense]|uniref:Lipoprotein n=1 Tax=Litoribaculum gwangyangense TaxID=1130722 RepID=A0ABP9CH95_9FLAO